MLKKLMKYSNTSRSTEYLEELMWNICLLPTGSCICAYQFAHKKPSIIQNPMMGYEK